MSDDIEQQPTSEVVLYQAKGRNVPVQVTYADETFWLSQKNIADLFAVDVRTISEHLRNIYETEELQEEATIRNFRIVRNEGSRTVRREIAFYNLDAAEFAKFERTQLSDFDRQVRGITHGVDSSMGMGGRR